MLRTPRGAVLGALLTAALAVGLLQAPGQAASQQRRPTAPGSAGVQEQPPAHRAAGRRPAAPDDAGREDRPDDPGRTRRRRRRSTDYHDVRPRQRAVGRRVDPGRATRPRRGPTWSTRFQRRRSTPGSGSRCCTASTRCTGTATCRAPPCSRTTSASARPATRSWSRRSSTSPRRRPGRPVRSGSFAPCICVARDDRWGRTYESFGETPSLVESMETVIDGFQGHSGQLDHADRVLATAKHFAGDGLTSYDEALAAPAPTRSTRASTRSPARSSTGWRSRRTCPAVQQAPRRLRDAVLLQRRLHRRTALGNPVKMHANQRADHRRAQGRAWASTAS